MKGQLLILAICLVLATESRKVNLNFGKDAGCPNPPPPVNCEALNPPLPDLIEIIKARDSLVCGVINDNPPFSNVEFGELKGVDVDLCGAVATAIFGTPRVQYIYTDLTERFADLKLKKFDVAMVTATRNFDREVIQDIGFSSDPYHWESSGLVANLEKRWSFTKQVVGNICTTAGSTTEAMTRKLLGEKAAVTIVSYATSGRMFDQFFAGRCDAIAYPFNSIFAEARARGDIYKNLTTLSPTFASEPLHAALRSEDAKFKKLVSWVIAAFFRAQELGYSSANINSIPENAFLSGPGQNELGLSPGWARKIIQQYGNIGDIYNRNELSYISPNTVVSDGGALGSGPFPI